ncbi:MAG: metal-dependent transcriptional regulator [Candidatus Zixiibacteriota bacterium]
MARDLSSNMEMYLKTILRLDAQEDSVRVKSIADALGVKMPSVSEAMKALQAGGLVRHPSYGSVQLTARGRKTAEAIKRRFDVLQGFFVNVLQLDQRTAARDACQMEHVAGPETLQRLTAFLDFVQHCRMDVTAVISHFREYVDLRTAGRRCHDCEFAANCELGARS